MHPLIELTEELVRYLVLVELARYVEVRGAHPDNELDAVVAAFHHRPAFGVWRQTLHALDRHLNAVHASPFARRLDDVALDLGALSTFEEVTARHLGKPARKGRVSPLVHMARVVEIRNLTAHGGLSPVAAGGIAEAFEPAIDQIIAAIPEITARQPIYVESIRYLNVGRYLVDGLALVGTSRPIVFTHEVEAPGALSVGRVYAWDRELSPLTLSPLAYFRPEQEQLYLLESFDAGVPEYRPAEGGHDRYKPDALLREFETRAKFLLSPGHAVASSAQPARAHEAYMRAARQAMADGVVTRDEWQMLAATRSGLGLKDEDVAGLHADLGIPSTPPPAAPAIAPTLEASPGSAGAPVSGPRSSAKRGDARARRLERAHDLDLADNFDAAIGIYEELLAERPDDDETRALAVELMLEVSRIDDAEALCREGLAAAESGRVRAALSHALLARGEPDSALEEANRAVMLEPTDACGWLALESCHDYTGDAAAQKQAMERALEVAPHDVRVQATWLGASGGWRDDPEKAVAGLRALTHAAPRDRTVRLVFANTLRAAGAADEALAEFASLCRRNPRWAEAAAFEALIHIGRRDTARASDSLERARVLQPLAICVRVADAALTRLRGDWETALSLFFQLWQALPGHGMVARWLATTLVGLGRKPEAIRVLTQHLVRAPEDTGTHVDLAQLLPNQSENDVLRRARSIFEQSPTSHDARLFYVGAMREVGNIDGAEQLLNEVRHGHGDDVEYHRAAIDFARGRHGEAERRLASVRARNPFDESLAILHVATLGMLGKIDDAVRVFDSVREPPPGLRLQLGETLAAAGRGEDAKRVLAALAGPPESFSAARAARLERQLGDLGGDFAQRAVREEPDSADAHFVLAGWHDANARVVEAIEHYEIALRLHPQHTLARNDLAVLLNGLGRSEDAAAHIRALVDAPMESKDLQVRLNGVCFCIAKLDVGRAMTHARAAVALDDGETTYAQVVFVLAENASAEAEAMAREGLEKHPTSTLLLLWLGKALLRMRRDGEALETAQRAARKAPSDPDIQRLLGDVLWRRGRQREAARVFRRAVELAPSVPSHAFALGDALARLGDLVGARQVFLPLLDAAESREIASLMWLGAYYETRRFNEGLELARELVQTKPDLAERMTSFEGICLKELGLHDEALPILRRQFDREPRCGHHIAEILFARGQRDEAFSVYERTIDALPGLPAPLRSFIRSLLTAGEVAPARERLALLAEFDPDSPETAELRALVDSVQE